MVKQLPHRYAETELKNGNIAILVNQTQNHEHHSDFDQ